jgi:alkanesulfonate monooxygenase SsuD/methylene tetrahydromethanopterin reductase-like flavin-dependent oxidoreductase (luciferase family)
VKVNELIGHGLIVGTAPAVIDQIGAFVEAGAQRFMLQWIDLDDIDGLEQIARDVLPHFHKAATTT